ncbi:MAG: glycosyltransferase family 4 protein [Anaerolineales bacterium]
MSKVILSANTDWYLYNFRLSLARELRREGFDVVLVSPPGKYVPILQQNGFRWLAWRLGRQTLAPWNEVRALLHLVGIYRQERPLLAHHHTIKPVLYGSWAARLAGVPGIVNSITGRGYIFLGEDFKARLLRMLVKPIYYGAFRSRHCAVIFENETDRRYFVSENLVPPERTWLIEGVGVDLDRFIPTVEPDGLPTVVLPARMLWDKGVGILVDAARLLHQKTQVRVALVGEPDLGNPRTVKQPTLEKWVEEGAVEWWGWCQDMKVVYEKSHIVTLPSLGEGVPTVLLEAAACGRPIVATDVPGCRQAVIHGSNGLLVPPNDAEALAEALYQLISDPALRNKMGASGRKLVTERFSNKRINAETLAVYRKIINHSEIP